MYIAILYTNKCWSSESIRDPIKYVCMTYLHSQLNSWPYQVCILAYSISIYGNEAYPQLWKDIKDRSLVDAHDSAIKYACLTYLYPPPAFLKFEHADSS